MHPKGGYPLKKTKIKQQVCIIALSWGMETTNKQIMLACYHPFLIAIPPPTPTKGNWQEKKKKLKLMPYTWHKKTTY